MVSSPLRRALWKNVVKKSMSYTWNLKMLNYNSSLWTYHAKDVREINNNLYNGNNFSIEFNDTEITRYLLKKTFLSYIYCPKNKKNKIFVNIVHTLNIRLFK